MSQTRKHVRISAICFIAIMISMVLPATLFAADPKIDVEVVETDDGYKLKFLNSECPGEPGKLGCVNVAKSSKNWIVWELDADSQDKGWVLSGLQFSDNGNWGGPLSNPCIATDFDADPHTGWALDFERHSNDHWARVRDENDCLNPYSVNYRLHAVNGQGDKADSDPVIRNGGRSGGSN